MTIRQDPAPPVDCDVCGAEIVASIDGFLDCEVVDLHDGTPPKDVCSECRGKPLTVIFPHILERKGGNQLRPAPAATVELELEAGEGDEMPPAEKTPAPVEG